MITMKSLTEDYERLSGTRLFEAQEKRKGTVELFLTLLTSKLTQSDARESQRHPNIHRLGHYMKAVGKVRAGMRGKENSSEPQDLEMLKRLIQKEFNAFGPVTFTIKKIDAYLAGKPAPKITDKGGTGTAWTESVEVHEALVGDPEFAAQSLWNQSHELYRLVGTMESAAKLMKQNSEKGQVALDALKELRTIDQKARKLASFLDDELDGLARMGSIRRPK